VQKGGGLCWTDTEYQGTWADGSGTSIVRMRVVMTLRGRGVTKKRDSATSSKSTAMGVGNSVFVGMEDD